MLIIVLSIIAMQFGLLDSKEIEVRKVSAQEIEDNYIDCLNRGDCKNVIEEPIKPIAKKTD